MSMKGFFILILFCCVQNITASGRPDVDNTLDTLIVTALRNNPDLKAVGFSSRSAEFKTGAAGKLPDPQLSFGLLNLPRSSFSFDETPMSGMSVGLNQTFPWPGKLKAKSSLEHLEADYLNLQKTTFRNNIARQVRESYYEYSYRTLSDSVLVRYLELITALTDVVETRYANGFGSAQDLLRVQTTRSRLETRRLLIKQQARSASLKLAWLTDNPNIAELSMPAYLNPDIFRDKRIFSTEFKENNPSLAGMAVKTGVAQKQLALTRAEYWPDFTVGVDYRIRKNIPGDPVRGEDFLTFKVGLRLPLWFSKQKSNSKAAYQTLQAAHEKERALASRIEQMINDQAGQLRTVRESFIQYDVVILPQAEAAFEAARVAYEVGQVDYNALIAAQLELLDIELERLSLLKDYHVTLAALKELAGDGFER